jgi:diguanylate cyclase (GGDEF)-like protein
MLVRALLIFLGIAVLALAGAAEPLFDLQVLDDAAYVESPQSVISGALDDEFRSLDIPSMQARRGSFWLRLRIDHLPTTDVATVNVRKTRQLSVALFPGAANATNAGDPSSAAPAKSSQLQLAAQMPGFRSLQEAVFILPDGFQAGQPLYAHINASERGAEQLSFATSTLAATITNAADHARMIAIAFGALMAMALSSLLIWFVLSEKLLLLYGLLFSLQAIYVAFLSGQGFEWPVLSAALPLEYYASKVPAGLSGAIACLFIREIAELQRFSPRVYTTFGWIAVAFVAITVGNLAQLVGLGGLAAMAGNLLFVGSGIFTLVVAFLAWRRNNRAAGWFLIAWALLETFTIATALRLLIGDAENSATLLYYGLPLSMIAAAVLVALGVADRLRDQRRALTDAESRAQIDPLTGVLNRRSFADRLDAACLRAQARGLPITLLFIDLDHFKLINDTFSHAAGDACLKAVIAPIQAELRQSDVVGRYGGEEFVVILSSADVTSAHPIAERIRKRVSDVSIEGFGRPISVTCSIGIASSDMLGVWGDQLITRADQAVYQAKRSGRNRVQVAELPSVHQVQVTA